MSGRRGKAARIVSTPPQIVDRAALAEAEPRFVAPALVVATDDGPALLAGCCKACGSLSFPRAQVCTECLSEDIGYQHLSQHGVLYSFTVVHQAPTGWTVPYVLGYVDLPEGIRVLAHLESRRGPALAIDQKVRLKLGQVGTSADGAPLVSYVFTSARKGRS